MSFEKRQPHDEDATELTAEAAGFEPALAALAEQLSDEANSLALCFPPRTTDTFAVFAGAAAATTPPLRRGARRLALVSGLCAATILIVLGWQAVLHFSQEGAVVEHSRIPVEQSQQMTQRDDTSDHSHASAEAAGAEENLLRGLSGAEQEAVLDLIESPVAQRTRLSI